MQLDDELCLCFHVTKRKVINFIRITRPKRAGQLAECYGAGTGCGWCRTYLCHLFEQSQAAAIAQTETSDPTAEQHAAGRAQYVQSGHGTPPAGATPIQKDTPGDSPGN